MTFDPVATKAKNRVPTPEESETKNWAQFWDMHSGGGTKVPPFEKIYVQLPDGADPVVVFQNLFGRNPNRVTCTCCGEDYSIDSGDSLRQLTGYQRGCACDAGRYIERGKLLGPSHKYRLGVTTVDGQVVEGRVSAIPTEPVYSEIVLLSDYVLRPNVLVVYLDELPDDVVRGTPHEEGYHWMGG